MYRRESVHKTRLCRDEEHLFPYGQLLQQELPGAVLLRGQ